MPDKEISVQDEIAGCPDKGKGLIKMPNIRRKYDEKFKKRSVHMAQVLGCGRKQSFSSDGKPGNEAWS